MTLTKGTDQLESARLVLRRVAPGDLPFFKRLHAMPEVVQGLGRSRTPDETATWLQRTLARYEEFSLGHLAIQRKADGTLIGRCGLTELVVETVPPENGLRKAWFGRDRAPPGLALTFECELGSSLAINAIDRTAVPPSSFPRRCCMRRSRSKAGGGWFLSRSYLASIELELGQSLNSDDWCQWPWQGSAVRRRRVLTRNDVRAIFTTSLPACGRHCTVLLTNSHEAGRAFGGTEGIAS